MSDANNNLPDEDETHISWPNARAGGESPPLADDETLVMSTTLHDQDATATAIALPGTVGSFGELPLEDDETLPNAGGGPGDTMLEFPGLAASALKEGSLVNNRFVIDELLGVGGMGVVYRALDKRKEEAQDRDPYVAIKILGDRFRKYPKAFVALQREARKSQSLAHPNVITVYDFDRDGDLVYMTMEQLAGSPMDNLIKANPQGVDPARAARIITGIAQGLAYAHSKGIVHSDLKPGNVFVLPDDSVKILDFGIARAVTGAASDTGDLTVFDAGELGGLTPTYASLEMFDSADPHPSDDVYALGVIAYELLAGEHPFGRKSAKVAAETGLKVKPLKGVSRHQWRAIAGALALPRAKRIPDAQAFLKQFGGLSKGVKVLGGALALSLVALVAALTLTTPTPGPEVPFDQLPVQTQTQLTSMIQQADEALAFGDVDGALYLLNEANGLHVGNLEVADRLEQVAARVLDTLAEGDFDPAAKLQRINTLLGYEALATNAELLAEKDRLEALSGPGGG